MILQSCIPDKNIPGQNISPFFQSLTGIRQGDNLSPTLFNIYVNDLPIIFDKSSNPPSIGNMTISSLMYADDLIVLSESGTGLQVAMDKLGDYCNQWGLTVNIGKTKFLVTKTDVSKRCLTYNEELIEQVQSFKYLGIEFSYDGSNEVAKSDLYKRGLKSYFKIIRSLNPFPKPHILLHLFGHLIKPILLYGCEIWSPVNLVYKATRCQNNEKNELVRELRKEVPFITKYMNKTDPIEKLHLKFCKVILGVHSRASNLAVYSELGRYPLFIYQITPSMKYINYIESDTGNRLLKNFYANLTQDEKLQNGCTLLKMREQLNIFMNTRPHGNCNAFYSSFKTNLKNSFNTYWHKLLYTDISTSGKEGGNKLRTYRKFKTAIYFEKYLYINNTEKRKKIAQLRISAHKLKIETSRFTNKNIYKPPELRLCENCNLGKIEDEYHFMLECPLYKSLRQQFFKTITNSNGYFGSYCPHDKFIWIMTTEDMGTLNQLGEFIINCFLLRKA